ncbi:MAG: hypothetical protein J6P57_00905 [Lachnospiraceae bacterium]|nr:hypothetical protein [Lachnospiraceae bacterium]
MPIWVGCILTGVWNYADMGWMYIDRCLEVCQQVFGYILTGAGIMPIWVGCILTGVGSMPIWVGCILTGVWKYADMGWMYTDRCWMYVDRCMIAADNFQI